MTSLAEHTPLESLLLLHALRSEGLTAVHFSQISTQLKSIPLIRNDPSYDSSRLDEHSLKHLCLRLLKDEAYNSDERKRRQQSPEDMATVEEAAKHTHLIPRVVHRLYTRYREGVVAEIRNDEARYDRLTREIADIESLHEPVRVNRASIDAVINHEPLSKPSPTPPLRPSSGQSQQQPAVSHRLSSTTTSLPPLSEMAPESPLATQAPPQQQQQLAGAPLHTAQGYRVSPVIQQNTLPPQFARPNGQPSPHHSPSPASPRPVLPLPPGMNLPHSPSIAQYSMPAHHTPPVPLQPATRAPHMHTPPAYHQPYPPPSHHQQQQQQPSSYPPQQPHQQQSPYPPRPPQQGGYQLPPFHVSAQQNPLTQQHHHHARQPPTPARQPVPTVHSPHTPYSSYHAPPYPRPDSANPLDVLSSLRKTPRTTLARSTTPRSAVRGATWKRERPSQLSRPYIDAVESPAPERPSPPPPSPQPSSPVELKPSEDVVEKPVKPAPRSTRRNRAASNASSTVASSIRTRTRSHSVLSHTESQSANQPALKDEPMTPADLLQEEILQAETSDPPSLLKSTRSRRLTTNKRKRQLSTSPAVPSSSMPVSLSSESEHAGHAYEPPIKSKVQAHRNFARISSVIINDITQHKHAGPFQKPVREKDAEGYGDIIKRPQDLKSIKAAITFGSRAITAATTASSASTSDSPAAGTAGTPSTTQANNSSSPVVLLDKTIDLLPPRAIVNSSQLEKEVMRMFANAVMFNPGMDEGMAKDAKEMAEDIEAKVRDWRQIEGAAASVSRGAVVDDTAGAEEDGVATAGATYGGDKKRRKV